MFFVVQWKQPSFPDCSIRLCAPFRQTSETFKYSEKDLHLANLQSMLHCVDGSICRGFSQGTDLLRHAGGGEGQKLSGLSKLGKDFAKARRKRLEQTFRQWTEGLDTPEWFNLDFLPAFTKMCNLLARADRKFCHASIQGDSKSHLMACAPHARVDDRILKVLGLPNALVVREVPGPGNSIEIVSPVAFPVDWTWLEKFGGSMMNPDAPGFVDYQIH